MTVSIHSNTARGFEEKGICKKMDKPTKSTDEIQGILDKTVKLVNIGCDNMAVNRRFRKEIENYDEMMKRYYGKNAVFSGFSRGDIKGKRVTLVWLDEE